MATDAVLLEQVGDVILGQPEQTLVQLAPIPPGRSYVISAKGSVFASNALATLTLEAFGAKDSVEIGFSAGQGNASFSLVVGVALPPDDELFTVAKVTGSSRVFSGGPATGFTAAKGVKLVVLAVDSVSVSQVSS